MSTTKSVDRQLKIIKYLMKRQLRYGKNCEKTNSKYRELLKLKLNDNN